ncbi:methyltransferase domain-containing protein [Lichenicoccus sp.]|uniref:methyltransferase domain-containing protein n=1 Tax=Lichenicoccus sp. TaxID=2781899 RepID=UPI003D101C53
MNRMQALLEGLDLARTSGLEIGALHNPILRKPAARVLYVDHVGTEALRAKYAGDPDVDPGRIVEVDVVWNSGPLDVACGGRRFDYVVASHVIEHIPDLVGWLGQLKSVLRPSGTVRLIIPDRRYCFDHRRETSSAADAILAARAGTMIPGPRQILDFTLQYAARDLDEAWRGQPGSDPPPTRQEYDRAIAIMEDALSRGAYHDVHCWVFTPLAFARLMRQLAAYGLIGFACTRCTATAAHSLDFFVHLMATDDERLIADTWDWAVRQHQPQVHDPDLVGRLQAELAALRASKSWRLTRPLRRLSSRFR